MRVLLDKGKEVLFTVLPITVIVLLLHFTIAPLPGVFLLRFLLGALLIVVGLAVFLFGVDIGISPLGEHIAESISRSNKIWIVVSVGFVVGFFVSVAEPDLRILSDQVEMVTSGIISGMSILLVVSVGIAALLVTGLLRILYNVPLYRVLTVIYGLIAVLSLFVAPEFLAVAFDASGATTGALTVPFILALGYGISSMKKDGKASEKDSFGLVAVTSTGAILGVLLMGILRKAGGLTGVLERGLSEDKAVLAPFIRSLPATAAETFVAVFPLLVIFIAFQLRAFHFDRRHVKRMLKGLLYTFVGLSLFLVGVNAGFMDVGSILGREIGAMPRAVGIVIGFVLGFVTVLAEPAVHVLTRQIEDVTAGYVRRKYVIAALSIGVGAAVALSILRIVVADLQLWHYLLPGFGLCIALSYIAPKLFVGIAFDAGGVASGPMTATFILAFGQGVADAVPGADVLKDAFGMIALVAMTPIITLQVLGLMVRLKGGKKEGVVSHE